MAKNLNFLLLVATTALLMFGGACSKENRDSVANRAAAPDIQNTWMGVCANSELLKASARDFYSFKGAKIVYAQEYYEDTSCSTPSAYIRYEGDYAVTGDNAAVKGAKNIDVTLQKVNVTAKSATGAKILRDFPSPTNGSILGFCGQSDWPVGRSSDMTTASTLAACPLEDMPKHYVDIVQVSGNTLIFGHKKSNEVRPESVDNAKIFTQVKRDL